MLLHVDAPGSPTLWWLVNSLWSKWPPARRLTVNLAGSGVEGESLGWRGCLSAHSRSGAVIVNYHSHSQVTNFSLPSLDCATSDSNLIVDYTLIFSGQPQLECKSSLSNGLGHHDCGEPLPSRYPCGVREKVKPSQDRTRSTPQTSSQLCACHSAWLV